MRNDSGIVSMTPAQRCRVAVARTETSAETQPPQIRYNAISQQEDVHAERAVRTEHDRLLDVTRTRGAGDQMDCARHPALRGADARERVLHRRDDIGRTEHDDVRGREQCRRRRHFRTWNENQRTGLGDRTEAAGDAQAVLAPRRARLDGQRRGIPVKIGELRPAHAAVRLLLDDRRRQPERVEVTGNRRGISVREASRSTVDSMWMARS